MTLEECIAESARRMEKAGLAYGHGTDNAWDDSACLVLHALGLPVTEQADLTLQLDNRQLTSARALIEERIHTRKPAAYLIGKTWFAGLAFDTAEGVIVPRSHLAGFLLDEGQPWVEPNSIHRVLDLCTGSGCIAIASAYAFPDAKVDGTDIDPLALQLARQNVSKHSLDNRVHIIDSDLYHNVTAKYDLILSNPPYVPSGDLAQLPPEYRHEPARAFDGGTDGLDLVYKIIDQARSHLNKQGALVMEVGDSWRTLLESRPELPFTWLETGVENSGVFLLYTCDLPT